MKIVCFGDSLTSCGGQDGRFSDILAGRFPDHEFVNRGVGGDSFAEARERLETDVVAETPDIVLVELGANDWWRDERAPREWASDLDTILARIVSTGARPVVLGVFGPYIDTNGDRREKTRGIDERAVAFREMEAAAAGSHRCPYVANIQERIVGRRCCWRDTNHPNEYGNRHVADAVEPVLENLLSCEAQPVRKPTLQTTRDMWDEAVELAPGRLAVVEGARRLTYAEADAQVQRIAAGLAQAAGGANPMVAVFLPNCLEYYLTYWAVVRLGGMVVPLNTRLKSGELAHILRNVRPDALLVGSSADGAVLEAAAAAEASAVIALDPAGTDAIDWQRLLDDGPEPPRPDLPPDAPSIIMHTSGTTDLPKGAVMRHVDLMFNVMTTVNAHQFNAGDVHLVVNPMFHCTALYSSLPTAAYTKTPVVITATTKPADLMGLVETEHISTFLSVPSVFQQLLKLSNLREYDASSLRVIGYAGSAMPVSTIRRLQVAFPDVDLHNFFGLTETISMTHVLTGEEAQDRPDSIGRLLPFVEAQVVDENGVELAPGEVGELLFARDNVIPGYYNQPDRLAASFVERDGRSWFRTGDLAEVDEEGYFFIKGRKKDMIIVGGENVYAVEVEAVLMSHDDIQEAAVKGVPAKGAAAFLGEQVRAFVVRTNDSVSAADIRKFCFERLPSYKVPSEVVFLDRLPRNPSGKVVKGQLE